MSISENISENIVAIVTVFGFAITILTLKKGRKDLAISNVIELQKLLIEYSDIHTNLLPDGDWNKSEFRIENLSVNEFSKFNSYFGVFEIAKLMIDNNSLSKEEFKIFFEYRLSNLKNCKPAMENINGSKKNWKNLLELIELVK